MRQLEFAYHAGEQPYVSRGRTTSTWTSPHRENVKAVLPPVKTRKGRTGNSAAALPFLNVHKSGCLSPAFPNSPSAQKRKVAVNG